MTKISFSMCVCARTICIAVITAESFCARPRDSLVCSSAWRTYCLRICYNYSHGKRPGSNLRYFMHGSKAQPWPVSTQLLFLECSSSAGVLPNYSYVIFNYDLNSAIITQQQILLIQHNLLCYVQLPVWRNAARNQNFLLVGCQNAVAPNRVRVRIIAAGTTGLIAVRQQRLFS